VLARIYEDRAAGRLEEGEFQALLLRTRQSRKELEEELNRLRRERERPGDLPEELLTFEALERGLVAGLVEEVRIHGDKRVEIRFRFREPGKK